MAMKIISVTDIDGFKLGNAENSEKGTGCTVVICEEGAVGGVDVRGGGPATRETDLLRSENTVNAVNAVVLSGGSAFGLEAASGVMRELAERNIGFNVDENIYVPIVCGASLYDLPVGDPKAFPDIFMGIQAVRNAFSGSFANGNHGAGTGATVGKLKGYGRAMKTGLGAFACGDGIVEVGAVAAVNAVGDIYNGAGKIVAGLRSEDGQSIYGTIKTLKGMVHDRINHVDENTSFINKYDIEEALAAAAKQYEEEEAAAEANDVPAPAEAAAEEIIEEPAAVISEEITEEPESAEDFIEEPAEEIVEESTEEPESVEEVTEEFVEEPEKEFIPETPKADSIEDKYPGYAEFSIPAITSEAPVVNTEVPQEEETVEEVNGDPSEEFTEEPEAVEEFSEEPEPAEEITEEFTEEPETAEEFIEEAAEEVAEEYAEEPESAEEITEESVEDTETAEEFAEEFSEETEAEEEITEVFVEEPEPAEGFIEEPSEEVAEISAEEFSQEWTEKTADDSASQEEPSAEFTEATEEAAVEGSAEEPEKEEEPAVLSREDMGYDIVFNTTISCLITNAALTKSQANKLASILHDAYARAIKPVHGTLDGDTVFVLATGKQEVNFDAFAALATDVMQYAIIDGAMSAAGAYGLPAAKDMQ